MKEKPPVRDVEKISTNVQVASASNMIFRVKGAGLVDIKEMASDLKDARLVVIGESHDNAEHHRAQLLIIQALNESGLDVSVGFEMFRMDAQEALDSWVAGEMLATDFREVYAAHWDRNLWPLYRPIFLYAQQENIPMVGLNVPRSIVSQVAREGFETLSDSQKSELGVVTCDVEPKYQNLIALVMGNKKSGDITFKRFCQAQVVWDTAMAQNAIRYLEEHPDRTMVIIAGSFHAWKHGIAEQVERKSDLSVRVVLPSSDNSFFNYNIMVEDADYVWWVEE